MATAINFLQMKTEVALRLGNIEDDDLYYDYLGKWVNRAANEVILRALEKSKYRYGIFKELEDEWITDATINDQGYVNVPSDCLVVSGVYSFDSSGAVDLSTTDLKVMTEITWRQYLLMPKASVGYPRLWNRYGNRIRIHPTPDTSYLTKLLIVGLAFENELSGDSDTLVMDPLWHPAVVDYATHLGAIFLGWDDDAERALRKCDERIQMCISVQGYENRVKDSSRKVRRDPTRYMR